MVGPRKSRSVATWCDSCVARSHKSNTLIRDLDVWQESMILVEDIYALSKRFPADERFGLMSQIRRAAVSIPSNIGEGARRKRRKACFNHLDTALGSVDHIGRMLNGLIASQQPEGWNEPEE